MSYFTGNSNSGSSNNLSNLQNQEERDKVLHDELAQSLKNLAKASDNYYASYLRVCQAKEHFEKSQMDLKNAEIQCVQAKKRYDQIITSFQK